MDAVSVGVRPHCLVVFAFGSRLWGRTITLPRGPVTGDVVDLFPGLCPPLPVARVHATAGTRDVVLLDRPRCEGVEAMKAVVERASAMGFRAMPHSGGAAALPGRVALELSADAMPVSASSEPQSVRRSDRGNLARTASLL